MDQRHFYTPSPFAEKYLLASDGMGIESNPKFLIDRDYFYNHLVMFVLSGTLCVEQGGKTFDIAPGFCILMTLTEPHKYYFKEKNSKIMWFHFRGFPVQTLISDLSARGCLPSVTKFSSELMDAQQLLLLRKNSQINAALEFHISSVLYRMILHLSASLFDRLQDDSLWGLKQNHPYLDYLDQHVNAPVNLDDMAANFHMSRFHFCHVFQKMFGMSPLHI